MDIKLPEYSVHLYFSGYILNDDVTGFKMSILLIHQKSCPKLLKFVMF